MTQDAKVHLKWVYTPKDFFEEKETTLLSGYEHCIENGEVTVLMDLSEYQNSPGNKEQLHNRLISIFKGAILVSQTPYTLTYAGFEIVFSDGKKENILEITSSLHGTSSLTVDVVVLGPNGEIIGDTRAERLIRKRQFANLSAKYRETDPVVESILSSFVKSLNNPKTALVHLFEIRDALAKRFSGEATAKSELGISNSHWDGLGILANTKPLNQGRHSGKHIGGLREATESEIAEARNFAIELVDAYLNYLEMHP